MAALFFLLPFGVGCLAYWLLNSLTGDSDGSGAVATGVVFVAAILMAVGAAIG